MLGWTIPALWTFSMAIHSLGEVVGYCWEGGFLLVKESA
jgi:hypothetical protein